MSCRQLLSLLLAVSIGSAFGATSVSSQQPGTTSAVGARSLSSQQPRTTSAFGATSLSSQQPRTTSAVGATSISSHRPETVTKSMTRSGQVAVPTSGIGHHLESTNRSSYQNGSATGSLRGPIKYATKQETQM